MPDQAQNRFPGLLFILLLFTSCNEESPNPTGNDSPITYEVAVPDGLLPWPHHKPNMTAEAYNRLLDDLWIVNNYGQYQCGNSQEQCYFHDGLDIVLPNGTPIYAVDSGKVRSILGSGPYYLTLIIEDISDPNLGWAYTHINNLQVKVGDVVQQGQKLGNVRFQGLEHIHFSRVKKDPGWSNFSSFVTLDPTPYFEFTDTKPPIITTPILYFPNLYNQPFTRTDTMELSGRVDLVAGVRDPGEHALSNDNYGDRLCIQKLGYRILSGDSTLLEKTSFDFSKIHFRYRADRHKDALTVFKFHGIFWPDGPPNFWNRFVSHYVLTNSDGNSVGEVKREHGQLSWDTALLDEKGNRVYPNGNYFIEIFAEDFSGNRSVARDSVWVNNP